MRRPSGALTVVCLLVLVVSGCSAGGTPAGGVSLAPSASVSASPTASSPVGDPAVDELLDWKVVDRFTGSPSFLGRIGSRWRVRPPAARSNALRFFDDAGNRVADVRPDRGWHIHQIYAAESAFVMVVFQPDPGKGPLPDQVPVRMWRVSLTTGKIDRLEGRRGVRPATDLAPYSILGDFFYYAAAGSGGGTCLMRLHVPSLRGSVFRCLPRSAESGWIVASPAGVGVNETDRKSRCKKNVVYSADGERRRELPQATGRCLGFGAVSVAGESPVWIVMTDQELPGVGTVWTLRDGKPLALGPGEPGTLRYCDGRAVWKWLREDSDASEVRTWRPGQPVKVVQRGFGDDETAFVLGTPECLGGAGLGSAVMPDGEGGQPRAIALVGAWRD